MTVLTTESTVAYTGDGATTDYAVPFAALFEQDLYVFLDGLVQTQGVNYTITGDITLSGATVSFMVAPANNVAIFFRRLTGMVQSTEYTTYGEYKAAQHEADYDKAMYIAQENRDLANVSGGGALPAGLFQTQLQILNSDGQFGAYTLSYTQNVFNGAAAYYDIPDDGTIGSHTWSAYDDGGVQRNMTLLGSGSITMPGPVIQAHDTTSDWGTSITRYGTTVASGPWVRDYLSGAGDLTGLGLARSWEFVDLNNAAQNLTLDPVTGGPVVSKQPDNTNPLSLATVDYVDSAAASASTQARGVFDGGAVTQLSGTGFAGIIRTAAVPAGSWDVTLSTAITIDDNMHLQVSGATFGTAGVDYNVGRVDDLTVRVTVAFIPDGTEVVNTPVDSVFHLTVVDLT